MTQIKKILILISLLCLVFASSCKKSKNSQQPVSKDTTTIRSADVDKNTKVSVEPKLSIPQERALITNRVVINTSKGKIVIGLYGKDAPKAVNNFLGLAKEGYYNGILFHRVAKKFLIQTGDGLTKFNSRKADWGTGGKSIYGEEFEDELDPETPSSKIGYVKGAIAMANRGPNSNTSQFFICLEEAENLEHKWTIFGRVVEGMNVVEKIASVEVLSSTHGKEDGLPKRAVRVFSVNIQKGKRR